MHSFLQLRLLFYLILWVVAAACRPANDVAGRRCLIGSISAGEADYIDKGKLTFDYNANQQLIKATLSFNNTQATIAQSFSYSPGRINMITVPAPVESGVVSATYSLNSAGYITTILSTERIYGSEAFRLTQQRFDYNQDGYLSVREDNNGRAKEYLYFQNNFFAERLYQDGLLMTAYDFSSYTDTPLTINPLEGVSTFTPFYAQGLFGKSVKNAIATTGNYRSTTDYSYVYDDKGRVTRIVQTNKSTKRVETLNYTYICP